MEVIAQAPQPTIKCYHSIYNGHASKLPYQDFTPESADVSGRNLLSYNFEKSIDNFDGSFSFTIKEDVENVTTPFMDKVMRLDIITISESGYQDKIDFIGVVTTVSIGGIASNLTKSVTVSGKSITWLLSFFNINADIKAVIFQNTKENNTLKVELLSKGGKDGISIKDIVKESIRIFEEKAFSPNAKVITNTIVGDIIKLWFGNDYIKASNEKFDFPISSNMFTDGRINVIDFIKKLLPSPVYEIFGKIENNMPKLVCREAPFDNTSSAFYSINPTHLTDFTLTRTCDEVYTAFMPYIEGSSMSPDFYMNLPMDNGTNEKGYTRATRNEKKVAIYGYQLLTCSFIGYNPDPDNPSKETINTDKLKELAEKLERWFSQLDDMYSGDLTIVNIPTEQKAGIGEWLKFAKGAFYVTSEKHSWNYGDNPMINYQVIRGGDYDGGVFKPLKKLSTVYREFE